MLAVVEASALFAADAFAEIVDTLDAFLIGNAGADRWVVGEADRDVVAIGYYAPERMAGSTWNLHLLAVHPRCQGQGWGRTVVGFVEDDLRSLGARLLLIETSGTAEFNGQRAFYAGLGYQQEATIRQFFGPGDDKVVFTRELTAVDVPAATKVLRPADAADLKQLVDMATAFYRKTGSPPPLTSYGAT